jgi:hypothetical protein
VLLESAARNHPLVDGNPDGAAPVDLWLAVRLRDPEAFDLVTGIAAGTVDDR